MTNGKVLMSFFSEKNIRELALSLSESGLCPFDRVEECSVSDDCDSCWKRFLNRDDGLYLDMKIPEK